MKIEYLIAVICITLLIAMPFSTINVYAQDEEKIDERSVGEAIVVNVKDYEPKVVVASVLEENDVPVYAFLEGYTLGKFLGVKEPELEPFYGTPKIERVSVVEKKYNRDYVRSIKYVPPERRRYSLDNLGYVVVMLKKVEKEHEVPDSITINLTAKIEFYFARGWGIGEEDLVLPVDPDEKEWMKKILTDYAFWSGDGYIRVAEIEGNKANIVIYDSSLRRIRTCKLGIGETCGPMTLRKVYGMEDQFRVELQDIVDPGAKRAELKMIIDGDVMLKSLVEGRSLYPGSEWKVHEIRKIVRDTEIIEEVTIKNREGDERIITRTYSYEDEIYGKKSKSEIRINKGDSIDIVVKKLRESFGIPNIEFHPDIKNHKFNESYFEMGTSLAEVLTSLLEKENLSHEYKEDKIIIKKPEEIKAIKDPCDDGDDVEKPADGSSDEWKKYYYCKAIDEFRQVIYNYPDVKDENGVLWEEKSYYWVGKAYDELYELYAEETKKRDAARLKALEAYKKAGDFRPEIKVRISEIEDEIARGLDYEVITIEDAGRTVELKLERVILERAERATALIEVGSGTTKEYKEGQDLFKEDRKDNIGTYNWKIKEIMEDKVIIEKVYIVYEPNKKEEKKEIEELRVTKTRTVDRIDIRVVKIDLKKRAIVTVLPGAEEKVYSESSFTLHIPIEKRLLFNLTPEQIDKEINKTEEIIKDLDKIIDKLEKLVKTWKTICLATFVFLTIKNSFFTGLSRTEARRKVMSEKRFKINETEYMGWKDYCAKNSGLGKKYKSYDVCMSENSPEITKQINEAQKMVEKTNKAMKEIKDLDTVEGQKKFVEVHEKNLDLNEVGLLYNYTFLTPEDARELTYLKFSEDPQDKVVYEEKIGEYRNKSKICGRVEEILNKEINEGLYKKDDMEYFINRNSLIEELSEKVEETTVIAFLAKVKKDKMLKDFGEKLGSVTIREVPGVYEATKTMKESPLWEEIREDEKAVGFDYYLRDPKTNEIIPVKKYKHEYMVDKEPVEDEVVVDGNSVWISYYKPAEKIEILYSTESEIVDYKNKNYINPRLQVDSEGRPYMIPIQGKDFPYADYVMVEGYDNAGNPIGVEIWNVGPNGIMGDEDDVIVYHVSKLNLPENKKWLNLANRAIREAGVHKKGEKATIFGKTYVIDDSLAMVRERISGPQCQDVMDPTDCDILFAVCDPVMCPPSRCNLGGRWQVSDVIQTGVIGSLVLCLPNFPKVPMPICLTGILAGLQNWRSILQGYVECLKTAKIHDLSVGICDKIRSVFICELIWREAIAIFNVHGGIMDWISESIFKQKGGGGEYLTFKDSMENVADSVKFFTQEYAQTAFAAYRARSAEEIGTEICRAAFFGKAPWIGEFIDQITRPESPPQFTAVFSEMPWSEAMKESRYSVYYHIYAGEDQEVTYSVFLRNKYDPDMGIVYVTEKCGGRRGRIEQGGFADYNVDCITKSGFNEVCVEINGKTSCGFGKVSSAFALEYLNDLIVEGELKKKIDSEAECVPDSTGLIRVCSVLNPGEGTNLDDWEIVGDCGKDEKGRFLGYCWLDMRTIGIKDAERYENVVEALEKTGLEYEKEIRGIEVWDKTKSKEELNEIEGEYEIDFDDVTGDVDIKVLEEEVKKGKYLQLIERYRDVIQYSVEPSVLAKAQFMIGMVYFNLAKMEKPPELERIGEKITWAEAGGHWVENEEGKRERHMTINGKDVIVEDFNYDAQTVTLPDGTVKHITRDAWGRVVYWEKEPTCEPNDGCKLECESGDPDCSCEEQRGKICDPELNRICLDSKGNRIDLIQASDTTYCCAGTCTKCRCSSGKCCDGCNFKKKGTICVKDFGPIEYDCVSDYVMKKTKYLFCDGESASCKTENWEWGVYEVVEKCDENKICIEDQPYCQPLETA